MARLDGGHSQGDGDVALAGAGRTDERYAAAAVAYLTREILGGPAAYSSLPLPPASPLSPQRPAS